MGIYDGRGSATELLNSQGNVSMGYSYGAFGKTTTTTNLNVDNPYQYNAEYVDDIPGVPDMQYLRARYYSPYEGRFFSQDTIFGDMMTPLSQNLYAYCHNNPMMFTDPSGRYEIPLFIKMAGPAAIASYEAGMKKYDPVNIAKKSIAAKAQKAAVANNPSNPTNGSNNASSIEYRASQSSSANSSSSYTSSTSSPSTDFGQADAMRQAEEARALAKIKRDLNNKACTDYMNGQKYGQELAAIYQKEHEAEKTKINKNQYTNYNTIMYNGEEYPIYVPNHLATQISPVWTFVGSRSTDKSMKIDWSEFVANLSIEGNERTEIVDKLGKVTLSSKGAMGGAIMNLVHGSVNSLVNSFENSYININFYKAGDASKAVITTHSSDITQKYNDFADGKPKSLKQYRPDILNGEIRESYNNLSGNNIGKGNFDILMTIDSGHFGSDSISYLSFDYKGNLIETPIILPNDKVEVVERSGFLYSSSTKKFEYDLTTPYQITSQNKAMYDKLINEIRGY